ncbi:MAG: RNA 2',3'-cyclic phosphodiesterase [Nanoarchaeota archaeon]
MRTFIAIDIPKEIKDRLYETQSAIKSLGIIAAYPHKKNLEITLAFLGDKTEEEISNIKYQLQEIKLNSFAASIKNMGSFPSDFRINVVWAGVDSSDLYILNSLVCKSINFKLDRPFNPHITLCRVKSAKNQDKLQSFIKERRNMGFGEFRIDSFVLKKSTLTKDGPKYENIEKFSLN